MFLFYANATGGDYLTGVIAANWLTTNKGCLNIGMVTVAQRQPPLMIGDLNGDGTVNMQDFAEYARNYEPRTKN